MNKKFSTLLVSALLAGGLFNSAYAVDFENAVSEQYYTVIVGGKQLPGKYTVKEVKQANGVIGFQLINEDGNPLSIKEGDVTYNTFSDATELTFIGTNKGYAYDATEGKWELGDPAAYTLTEVPAATQNADDLNAILGNGFGLQICYQETKDGELAKDDKGNVKAPIEYSNLKGNVFTDVLYAERSANGVVLRQNNKDGKQIVLLKEQWGGLSNSLAEEAGYKFAAVTEKELEALVEDNKIKGTEFKITVPATVSGEPVEVLVVTSDIKDQELVVAEVDGTYYLTTSVDKTTGVADYNFTVGAKDNTYVKLGVSNLIDYAQFKDVVWNISFKDEMENVDLNVVAGPACYNGNWVPAAQVATAYPEGQWLYTGDKNFVNRESGVTINIADLRKIDGKTLVFKGDLYYDNRTINGTYTFTKAGVPGDVTIGYLNGYSDDALKQKAFRLGTPVKATGDTVYVARGAEGALYLSNEVSEAVEFRLTKQTWGPEDNQVDVIKHFTTYASAKTESGIATDTINFYKYYLEDAATGEYFAYDDVNQKFILSEDSRYRALVFKNKDVNTYNLLDGFIYYNDGYTYDIKPETNDDGEWLYMKTNQYQYGPNQEFTSYPFCNSSKLYGAHNTAELVAAEGAYEFVQNDLFILSDADAMQYVSEIQGDTIKLFRHEDPNYVVYEKKGFLGLENFLDPTYTEKNPAILADNGAGKGTWRPEYLLAVDAEYITDGWTCPFNPEHNTTAWREEHGGHCADAVQDKPYMTGRYLVALGDSSIAAVKAGEKDIYSYQTYGGEKYYKLAFVPAVHIGDSLIIASTNDTIDVVSNAFDEVKPCDFAFHYTDASRTSFTIETAYAEWDNAEEEIKYLPGYLKYHNGVPVVTKQRSEAEVFELEVLEGIVPTDNEEITVEEGVSVIAGNGYVEIQGAAGKNVVVTNILGKVIANTVLTSDNQTINVPAGIVVVAVEGEEAAKAVVK